MNGHLMRFLLISDTHGKLEVVNELADSTQADAVIHAGDFGFYDDESYDRLSERELRLHIVHSDLAPLKKRGNPGSSSKRTNRGREEKLPTQRIPVLHHW